VLEHLEDRTAPAVLVAASGDTVAVAQVAPGGLQSPYFGTPQNLAASVTGPDGSTAQTGLTLSLGSSTGSITGTGSFSLHPWTTASSSLISQAYDNPASLDLQVQPEAGTTEKNGDPVTIDFTLAASITLQGVYEQAIQDEFVTGNFGTTWVTLDLSYKSDGSLSKQQTGSIDTTIGSDVGFSFKISLQKVFAISTSSGASAQISLSYEVKDEATHVLPTPPSWDASSGGVKIGYTVGDNPVPHDTRETLFWSKTDQWDGRITDPVPAFSVDIAAGTAPGSYGPFLAAAKQLGTPPEGAHYLLEVTDPDNSLGNFDSNANVQAISLGVVPTKVAADPKHPGALVVTYHLGRRLAAGQTIPVSLYWATGPQGTDALPSGMPQALLTYVVTSKVAPGTRSFPVPATGLTTAPASATYLLVISDPAHNQKGGDGSDPNAILVDKAQIADPTNRQLAPLTPAELQELMPGLDAKAAGRYAPVLAQAMFHYKITTLEQEAMFLGQVAHETNDLRSWSEKYNGDPESYFINKYWISKTQWSGLGASVPNADGIMLKVPHAKPASNQDYQKEYELYWAQGKAAGGTGLSAYVSPTLDESLTFNFSTGYYTNAFPGAGDGKNTTTAQLPPGTSYLLVFDPATKQVVLALNNHLGNWSPKDATDYQGRGALQLTGRYNYQQFANSGDPSLPPSLMNAPEDLADNVNDPAIGIWAGAFFWEGLNGHHLNAVTDHLRWASSVAFNRAVTLVINKYEVTKATDANVKAVQDRLQQYLRIRALLLDQGP
jgi:predicted chitinase